MLGFGSLGFGNLISTVFEKFQTNPFTERYQNTSERSAAVIKFHHIHGKAVQISEDSSAARRDPLYFEHAVVFSHRPINPNEVVAIEIKEITSDYYGPLRVGFTRKNPETFSRYGVPLGRDLKSMPGVWLKSVHLCPTEVGNVVYLSITPDGTILYGINGQQHGILLQGVSMNSSLWAVVEAYGAVQTVSFVDKTMLLQIENDVSESPQDENMNVYYSPNLRRNGRGRRFTRSYRRMVQAETAAANIPDPDNNSTPPLRIRRNVQLSPLQAFNFCIPSSTVSSSAETPTPAFFSPNFSPGLCIICTDREKNTAFTKCGHLCMCYECAETFKNQNRSQGPGRGRRAKRAICPICRRPIISLLRIYN